MGLFNDRLSTNNKNQTPVWFMRQAGRYHSHYQNIKKDSDFMSMCKTPELAHEITMGPIECFDFDAAILFSDLLFPLEQLNMGLNYLQGPPQLSFKVAEKGDLSKLKTIEGSETFYQFQYKALTSLRASLPKSKTLIGFNGAPFTLYAYAVEGSHSGNIISSKRGFYDGRFEAFMELLLPNLVENLVNQAKSGADCLSLFDTAVGEICPAEFQEFVLPKLKYVTKQIKLASPNTKIIYYSKHTNPEYFRLIQDENIDVLGVDWRNNLPEVLKEFGKDYYIQGNIDPSWLHYESDVLKNRLQKYWESVQNSGGDLSKWIFGLGHGVLVKTPEENVQDTVKFVHENCWY